MKTWTIEIEVQTESNVTVAEMKRVAEKIADDAAMRVSDEVDATASVMLADIVME